MQAPTQRPPRGRAGAAGGRGLFDRRERHGHEDLVLLVQERAEVFVAPEELLPVGVLGHDGAAVLAIAHVWVLPELHHLIERAGLGGEEADEAAHGFARADARRQRMDSVERLARSEELPGAATSALCCRK